MFETRSDFHAQVFVLPSTPYAQVSEAVGFVWLLVKKVIHLPTQTIDKRYDNVTWCDVI